MLSEEGSIERTWNHHRFKAIRDFLSDLGLIDWEDESYKVGFRRGDEWVPGVAMKWSLDQDIMEQLQDLRDEISARKMRSEKKRRVKASSIEHSPSSHEIWVANLSFCDPEDQIRPARILRLGEIQPNPDEITAICGHLEVQAA